MGTSSQEAAAILREIEQARQATVRQSADNGVVLIVWGLTFLLDMVAFDLSRLTGSPLAAVLFVAIFNAVVLAWRGWYARRLPIRLLHATTYRIIFLWSWYYVALIGLGVGLWAIVLGHFPPFWFTVLGIVGALPLLFSGARQWRRAHRVGPRTSATQRPAEAQGDGIAHRY